MIRVNGQAGGANAGESVSALLARLRVAADSRGVAVAVDGEVVPRSAWDSFILSETASVEVLGAMQGG
jgi:sulfur carrier protein